MTSLYIPSSLVPEIVDNSIAIVAWFKYGAHQPDGAYADLIQDYEILDEVARSRAEQVVKEMLNAQELAELADYLLVEHGWRVLKGRVPLPFYPYRGQGGHLSPVLPYSLHLEGPFSGIYRLDEEPSYNLGIRVRGYYSAPPHSQPVH